MMALDILVKNVALPGNERPCGVGITNGCFVSIYLAEAKLETRRYFDIPAMPVM
jgi:hypothetical protein